MHIQDREQSYWEQADDSEHMYGLMNPKQHVEVFWIQYLRRHRPHLERQYKALFYSSVNRTDM